jgi:NAD(P)-dependent dehydrogenase (short-subunit alcohol dehydrogenase family)
MLGSRGFKVFVTGRNEANLAKVVAEVASKGGEATFGTGDVQSEADVERLYSKALEYFGGASAPDVLVYVSRVLLQLHTPSTLVDPRFPLELSLSTSN